jgi:hypothetical protein
MARFKYKGELPRPGLVKKYGQCKEIIIPTQEGKKLHIKPLNGKYFLLGEDVGIDINDPRALRELRADPRFEEITDSIPSPTSIGTIIPRR